MADLMDSVITVMLAVFLGSVLLPVAFDSWFNATTSSWGSGTAALWVVVPIMALIGIVLGIYNKYGKT